MTTTTKDYARLNIWKVKPSLYPGMSAFQSAAAEGLDPVVAELIKIRISQINKCAYCIDMHVTAARKEGESQLRLDLLSAWQEVEGLYTERERAALALGEAITLLTDGFVPDEVYERAAALFEEAELAALIAQIVAINSWNRLLVTTRAVPAGLREESAA